jgi:uncharacterized LabA/DUF88 family protein
MRSQCAIYVDAGYLLASAATRVTGTSLRRGVQVDHGALVAGLMAQAEADSGMPLLRLNWYDSGARPGGMPDARQEELGQMPRVKLRLGRLSYSGEQKGVDVRLGLDLATQGRQRVVDIMYLVTGDDDLTEAVEEAQSHGVQVVLMPVPDVNGRPHALSKHLLREADGVLVIDTTTIDDAVKPARIPEDLIAASVEGAEVVVDGEQPAESPTLSSTPSATPDSEGVAGAAAPGAGEASAQPEAPAAAPTAPTPAVFAAKKATTLVLSPAPAGPPAINGVGDAEIGPVEIDAVARRVVESWCLTASPESLVELRSRKPNIPSDLDRTLLVDLSAASGSYDIDEQSRHAIRERFWRLVEQVQVR